jgi:predicted nucleic acid-binding protein
VNVLTRKQGVNIVVAHEVAESLLDLCEVVPVDASTIRAAIRLVHRYKVSHWDSLIVAAALLAGCEKLYSQDMQHGQRFDEQLKVVNHKIKSGNLPSKSKSKASLADTLFFRHVDK